MRKLVMLLLGIIMLSGQLLAQTRTVAMFDCNGVTNFTWAISAIPYSHSRFIWPIPEIEIRQNPNYYQNTNINFKLYQVNQGYKNSPITTSNLGYSYFYNIL